MNKLAIAACLSILIVVSGCSNPEPAPISSPTAQEKINPEPEITEEKESTENRNPATDRPAPQENNNTREPNKPEATTAPPAEPPATQFLRRWGQRFTEVQEATIIKVGSNTCERIAAAGDNWENNNEVNSDVAKYMTNAGFGDVSLTTAADFATDANQNLCSTLS